MPLITSLQNPRVKDAVRLRDRRSREKQGCILIEGAREILHAMRGGVRLQEIFVCPSFCHSPACQQVLRQASALTAERLEVSPAVFEKLAFGQRTEGVLAVAATPERKLADLSLSDLPRGDRPLIAVLEGVEKPGNVGAVIRSADAAGLSAVVVAEAATDLYNPNAIRASLGTIFTMPVCSASSREAIAWMQKHQIPIFAARVDGAIRYTEADLSGPAAIVLGSEAAGLSDHWLAASITAIKLPMLGAADSLNISATAAVLFYEALRQRDLK